MSEPEVPLILDCAGTQLLGILHRGAPDARRAVLVVVGGPQYRVGSHRQFVLLARRLAAAGIPTLRFDCRGMGDSDGDPRGFEAIQEDIAAAIDRLFHELPTLRQVVLWGLCDAATAAALYAAADQRVAGLVLLNPWVRTPAGEARTYLRHYYTRRLLDRQFWIKLLGGRVRVRQSVAALGTFVRSALGSQPGPEKPAQGLDHQAAATAAPAPFAQRMLRELRRFHGPVLLILSGNDLTAKEFDGLLESDRAWSRWVRHGRVERRDLPDADHTFSSEVWRAQVEDWTLAWLHAR